MNALQLLTRLDRCAKMSRQLTEGMREVGNIAGLLDIKATYEQAMVVAAVVIGGHWTRVILQYLF